MSLKVVVSFGGGTDSTGLLIAAKDRGIRPDRILFADTGAEMPHTVAHLERFNQWLIGVGFPQIEVIRWYRQDGSFLPLDAWCEKFKQLPSKAYGMSGCTSKWKQQPLDKAVATMGRVERWVGYDASEWRRIANLDKRNAEGGDFWRAPLAEWKLARADCVALIAREGLPQPGKSACYICPMNKPDEILAMARDYPELAARAVAIEAGALEGINDPALKKRGLGMRTPKKQLWGDFLKGAAPAPTCEVGQGDDEGDEETPCGCHD